MAEIWEENPCGMLVRQLHLMLNKRTNNSLREQELTMSQLMALLILSRSEGGELSLKELERHLHTSQPDVAGVASRLTKKGMVDSFADPQDKRMKRVRITPRGTEYAQNAKSGMEQAEQALLSKMSLAERQMFRELLQKAVDGMQ